MRKLLLVAALAASALLLGGGAASAADGQDIRTLDLPKPAWLTGDLEARIVAAGPQGLAVPEAAATVEANCIGTAPPYAGTNGVSLTAVSAGTCMVSPAGCTMNFIFTDGTSNYIGTAGHCAGNGKTVIAQVGTRVDPTDSAVPMLAAIGTTVKSWNNGIGRDFALVKIDPGFNV